MAILDPSAYMHHTAKLGGGTVVVTPGRKTYILQDLQKEGVRLAGSQSLLPPEAPAGRVAGACKCNGCIVTAAPHPVYVGNRGIQCSL